MDVGVATPHRSGRLSAARYVLRIALLITIVGLWWLNRTGTEWLFEADVHATVPSAGDAVALTFDDGPSAAYTPDVLDILAEHDAKATFFVVGESAAAHPDIIERIIAEGHEIGHHTYTHPLVEELWPSELAEEMDRTCEVLVGYGVEPQWYRPPRKGLTLTQKRMALERGMRVALWTRVLERRQFLTPHEISETLVRESAAGDVLLAHDGRLDRSDTVAALPELLEGLADKGLEVVTLSELYARSGQHGE